MKGRFIQSGRSLLALILCVALLTTGLQLHHPLLHADAG